MKTAIELLIDKMQVAFERGNPKFKLSLKHFMEEAKRIKENEEKQQIEYAYISGIIHPLEMEASKQAEQYYNETFKH